MTHEPIAYTYEADTHCETCAEARFGRSPGGMITGIDREGNAVGALFSWDEWTDTNDRCQVLPCGDCGTELDAVHCDRCRSTSRVICDNTFRAEMHDLVTELAAHADDHRYLVHAFDTDWRVRFEPDMDWSLADDGDWFGRIKWTANTRNEGWSRRPDDMDGRARIVERDGRECLWWQPPADVTGDAVDRLGSALRDALNYGAAIVFVERMSDVRDAYGHHNVNDYACVGGVLGDGWAEDVIGDLMSELIARWIEELTGEEG